MIRFNTEAEAQAHVAYRVTCERTDEGGVTHYEVVDRLAVPRSIVEFADEQSALAARDAARASHVQEATVH